jgi:hypothetical protein
VTTSPVSAHPIHQQPFLGLGPPPRLERGDRRRPDRDGAIPARRLRRRRRDRRPVSDPRRPDRHGAQAHTALADAAIVDARRKRAALAEATDRAATVLFAAVADHRDALTRVAAERRATATTTAASHLDGFAAALADIVAADALARWADAGGRRRFNPTAPTVRRGRRLDDPARADALIAALRQLVADADTDPEAA